ncbi:MAG TPA: phosphatase PAP2 family protein [Clostridiaceae bacterium]|nr:phosphatase PAP2 family protein [Clostridiaceae bacterium]
MKNRNLVESFNNAIKGIINTIRTERNMKIHITASVLVILLSFLYKLSRTEFLIVLIVAALVLICELFNTAVEKLIDLITDVYHPKVKIVKDIAAGAVMISAGVSLIAGYVIFINRVSSDVEAVIVRVRNSPLHMTVIALIITIIFVVIIKLFLSKGTPLKGGMPSGHSAIAFSITTGIALWTQNARITILCLIISLLLVQSRLEGKIHTVLELITGALLGTLLTLLVFQICNSL